MGALAFPHASNRVSLTRPPTARTSDALLTLTSAGPQNVHDTTPGYAAYVNRTDTFPTDAGNFTLPARSEPPTAIAAQ